jgi:hypothetical protein
MKLYHERSECILCGSRDLANVVPLEPMPIATPNFNTSLVIDEAELQRGVPLSIFQCKACGHLQVIYFGNPEVQYRDYIYTTSISLGLSEHFRRYADETIRELALPAGGLVVEMGSNDGTLLRAFKEAGMRVVGIDPARQIAETATQAGITTLPEFFSKAIGERIAREFGPANLFVANNVLANIEPMGGVADGVAAVLADDGVFVFETQYGADVIERTLLDTIYHEHISYFLLKPLVRFFHVHGLELFDVVRVPTKGGSFRAFVQKASAKRPITQRLLDLLEREDREGMYAQPFYDRVGRELTRNRAELRVLVDEARALGRPVAGYGVSVGTSTLLAQFHLTGDIDFLVDDLPGIQSVLAGPGYVIPVVDREEMTRRNPAIVIVFAWRYTDAIVAKNGVYLSAGGAFAVPLPTVRVLREAAAAT